MTWQPVSAIAMCEVQEKQYLCMASWDSSSVCLLEDFRELWVAEAVLDGCPVMSLTFAAFNASDKQKPQPYLAAGLADGRVTVSSWSTGGMTTLQEYRVGNQPVTLHVAVAPSADAASSPVQGTYIVACSDTDAVLHCQEGDLCCSALCNTTGSRRLGLAWLGADTFAWLTTEGSLCFGTVEWDMRAQWRTTPLSATPVALAYLPRSLCIVVATEGISGGSALRVFNANTLEEVWSSDLADGKAITALCCFSSCTGADPSEMVAVAVTGAIAAYEVTVSPSGDYALEGCASFPLEGGCFFLEPFMSDQLVLACNSDIQVLGWSKQPEGFALECQANAKTSFLGCVTSMSTRGEHVAVAELLYSVAIYRLMEDGEMAMVAQHTRGSLLSSCLVLGDFANPNASALLEMPVPDVLVWDANSREAVLLGADKEGADCNEEADGEGQVLAVAGTCKRNDAFVELQVLRKWPVRALPLSALVSRHSYAGERRECVVTASAQGEISLLQPVEPKQPQQQQQQPISMAIRF
ncbi:unnamed protein product [Chrysoparadoxa australica]